MVTLMGEDTTGIEPQSGHSVVYCSLDLTHDTGVVSIRARSCGPDKPGRVTILDRVTKDTSYGKKKKKAETGEGFTVATWGKRSRKVQ